MLSSPYITGPRCPNKDSILFVVQNNLCIFTGPNCPLGLKISQYIIIGNYIFVVLVLSIKIDCDHEFRQCKLGKSYTVQQGSCIKQQRTGVGQRKGVRRISGHSPLIKRHNNCRKDAQERAYKPNIIRDGLVVRSQRPSTIMAIDKNLICLGFCRLNLQCNKPQWNR